MDILGYTLTELLDLIEKKKVSSQDVWGFYSKRIEQHNKALNVYLSVNEEHSYSDGVLKGLPLAVKDNFNTTELPTTASSKVLDGFVPPYNATVIRKIKEAGGSILGKVNMDAWAHGSSTETSDYGVTKNPYDTSKVPGGSSGGSSVAVAAGLAPAALGTETAGSIRQPASWSGVVGLKPTYGRVSRYGVIAMGSSWDCPGVMTQTVDDAAFLIELIAGHDKYDATTSKKSVNNYTKEMNEDKKYTIGIAKEYFNNVNPDIIKSVEDSISKLQRLGHTVKEISLIDPKYSISVYMILQRSEVSSNLSRYDGIRYGKNRRYFGEEAERRIMLGTYSLSHGYYDAYYKKALKVRQLIAEDFKKAFTDVDLIVAPTTPITATKIGDIDEFSFYGEMMDILTEPGSAAGIPAISIPSGLDSEGMPIGIQFMGNHFEEGAVLNIAKQLETEINFDRTKVMKESYS